MEHDIYKLALTRLCEREGGVKAVAAAIASSPATLDQIIKGVKLPSGKPKGVGPALRTRILEKFPDWLDSFTLHADTHGEQPAGVDDDVFVIRQYDTGGSMGSTGIVLHDQPGVIKEWRVTGDWLRLNVHHVTGYENLAIVTGFGPSMQPVFNPGDPLLVDTGVKRADVDGVYFFRVGTEGFVKQLQRIPTSRGMVLRAKSYNPLYDSFEITQDMDFEVFARVVKVWKSEEF